MVNIANDYRNVNQNYNEVSPHNCQRSYIKKSTGTVIKNLPANAGNTGSSPGPGRSHMPWNN